MIVFAGAKGKVKRLNDKYTGKCYIASSANAWMNEELTKSWVQNVLGRLLFTGQRLLAWDACRCHLADTVREELRISRVDTVIIPGGCTKYIQEPDVS